jgi:hypothetical protein
LDRVAENRSVCRCTGRFMMMEFRVVEKPCHQTVVEFSLTTRPGDVRGSSLVVTAEGTCHVQNSVGLVEHQDLQLGTIEVRCLVHVLQKPAWGADENIHP